MAKKTLASSFFIIGYSIQFLRKYNNQSKYSFLHFPDSVKVLLLYANVVVSISQRPFFVDNSSFID